MNNNNTTSTGTIFCYKCGRNLSKAINVIYIDGLPICPWCLTELNNKIIKK